MNKPRVVVITPNRRVLRHVTRALASADWVVQPCSFDPGQLEAELETPAQLYIVDGDEDLREVQRALLTIQQRGGRTVVMSHESGDRMVLELFASTGLSNFVGRHGGQDSSQDMIDEDELIVTCQKLVRGDVFGLEKYMSTWGMRLHQHPIRSTADKIQAIEDLEDFLVQIDCYRGIVPAIALVGEELVMNALFNAPRGPEGEPRYMHVDRRQSLVVQDSETVDFSFACDGCYVGMAVRDRFGSLDRATVVSNLERCYRRTQGMVDDLAAGAGLGLYMIFNSITQLVINVQPGQQTEVIALFYVRSGARAFKSSGRSFNIFSV